MTIRERAEQANPYPPGVPQYEPWNEGYIASVEAEGWKDLYAKGLEVGFNMLTKYIEGAGQKLIAMNKKLIHKNGKIATLQDNNNYYTVDNEHYPIPAWIIEGDDSWSPVEEQEQEYSLTLNLKVKPSTWKQWVSELEKATGHPVEVQPVLLELERDSKTESPKVILTTEDGVDITDPEQQLYDLSIDNWWKGLIAAMHAAQMQNVKTRKFFSTSEARDVYIENYKPVLCKNDLMPWYDGSSIIMDIRDLHGLVTKKLKKQ